MEVVQGLRNLRLFKMLTEDTASTAATYDATPINIEMIQEFGCKPKTKDSTREGDDRTLTTTTTQNVELTIKLLQVPLEYLPYFQGGSYNATTKEYSYDTAVHSPYIGLTLCAPLDNSVTPADKFRGMRFFKVKFLTCNIPFKTSTDATVELTAEADIPFNMTKVYNWKNIADTSNSYVTDISSVVS